MAAIIAIEHSCSARNFSRGVAWFIFKVFKLFTVAASFSEDITSKGEATTNRAIQLRRTTNSINPVIMKNADKNLKYF